MDEEIRDEVEVNATQGFLAAAFAPALLAGGLGLVVGPLALMVFFVAFTIAALHVALLAAPLYALLRLWREPGPAMVLLASLLIGALPVPILYGWSIMEGWVGGVFGLVGGGAFLICSRREPLGKGYGA